MDVNPTIVSIVVCTYNRAGILMETLEALENQSADKSLYEVIVVNNNSTDLTREVAERFASQNINFRVVLETLQGASYARNRGFAEAKAEWVAYLDDDSRALSNYVERLIYVIRKYDFDGFGGVYLPWYKYGRPKWFKDHYGSNTGSIFKTGIIPDHLYCSGGNCAFKKTVLEEVGGFPLYLGPRGDRFSYGEETLLQVRMRKEGKKIGFDPELMVDHVVMPHKLRVSWFFKSDFSHGKDYWRIFDTKPTVPRILRIVSSMIGSPIFYFPTLVYRLFGPKYYFQNFCIDLLRPTFSSLGKVHGAVRSVKKCE